jgi:hypothetical protein
VQNVSPRSNGSHILAGGVIGVAWRWRLMRVSSRWNQANDTEANKQSGPQDDTKNSSFSMVHKLFSSLLTFSTDRKWEMVCTSHAIAEQPYPQISIASDTIRDVFENVRYQGSAPERDPERFTSENTARSD